MKRTIEALMLAAALLGASASAPPIPAPLQRSNFPVSSTARDGRNDFDFELGTWRTHYRILRERLAGSHDWYDCYGTSIVIPFWGGGGNLEDGDLRCPNRYIGGLTLRTYDPQTHQWTLWWGTKKLGVAPPQQVGHFDAAGVGRFYAYDRWHGRPVICRFQWTKVNGNPRFEQAYSVDGGRTWETNWTTDYVRVSPATKGVWNATGDSNDDFAFLLGTWQTHSVRLLAPFAGDRARQICDGTSVVRPFWAGSGNLEDADLRGQGRRARAVAMRIYDGAKRQWLLYRGTQTKGLALGLPAAGSFHQRGIGDFYTTEIYDGKRVTVRDRWEVRDGNPRYERALSPDGGKTWENVATTDYTRVESAAVSP
jgi:hypothetical protein